MTQIHYIVIKIRAYSIVGWTRTLDTPLAIGQVG